MPTAAEQHFRWAWELASSPEALWPLVSDTDRFNRDCGYPPVELVPPAPPGSDGTAASPAARVTNVRRLRAHAGGILVEWDELAFEWLAPRRYAVERSYHRGPLAKMVMSCELQPRAGGGTTLTYDMRLTPSGLLGRLALPFAIGRKARAITEKVFRRYDEFAQQGLRTSQLAQKPALAQGGAARLAGIRHALIEESGQPAPLVARLADFVHAADDLAAAKMRPYALADQWQADRRETLKLFLHSTRAGLLDFSWDLVCPHCRGAKASQSSLTGLTPRAHCDSCNMDFTANFDQSVELTFTPNPAVRKVVRADYCVGGPQVTPHIVAQQLLPSGGRRRLPLGLQPGRYRLRAAGLAQQHAFRVAEAAPLALTIDLATSPLAEPEVAPGGELTVAYSGAGEQLAIVERVAWSDQAATAAEVTSLQLFRDLFSREVLRPGEQISVGAMTIVFTDLKNSTQLYQEIGDAPAFGRVLTHFEILKATVAAEGGAIVKTMGDAIMAVFPRPLSALRAVLHAQRWLAHPQDHALPPGVTVPPSSLRPLALKAGLHSGPCLAINQNERLDYFGTTVNFGARLCGLCTGSDLVLSAAVRADPEIGAWLADPTRGIVSAAEQVRLKGFGDAAFEIWRLQNKAPISRPPF
jgi:class 3 adenylate cyclase